jgi:hypothetical protein
MSINILKCSQVPSLSSKSLQMLVSKCTQLRVLDLSYVALLNDIALRALTRCCQALVELDLSWCESLSPGAFSYVAQFCQTLERLNVSRTAIGDEEILAIIQKCGNLVELKIMKCSRITPAALETVIQEVMRTTCLDVSCEYVDRAHLLTHGAMVAGQQALQFCQNRDRP